ncbi:MAG: hypothetical protein COA63_008325 [Methylophaga sp.]|nr:hypothetical protein [Methylophaga sp.]
MASQRRALITSQSSSPAKGAGLDAAKHAAPLISNVRARKNKMTNVYCAEFKNSSEYIHNWLSKQSSVGEESITDWILFTLSQSLPQLKYKKFTRHQEARTTGADWEWWIVDKNSAISMRIQAKKIIAGKDNYAGLAHTNKYGLQIEKLIEDAKLKKFIPFYALYSAPKTDQKVICGGQLDSAKQQGVFIASAQLLYDKYIKNGKVKVEANDVLSQSNPLHCMACCSMLSHGRIPSTSSFYQYIENYYGESLREINSNIQDLGRHDNAPSYVTSLLDAEDAEIPDWWEKEFQHQIEGFNSLMILDLRGSNE